MNAMPISNSEILGMMVIATTEPAVEDITFDWRVRLTVRIIATQAIMQALHWAYHNYCGQCLWDYVELAILGNDETP